MEHCSRMDDLKVVAQTLVTSKRNLIEEIKSAMRCLASVEEELRRVKSDAMSLQTLNKEIETEFTRIEQTYFTKKRHDPNGCKRKGNLIIKNNFYLTPYRAI